MISPADSQPHGTGSTCGPVHLGRRLAPYVFLILFSAVYSFVAADRSPYSFSGDLMNVCAVSLSKSHPEIFRNDFNLIVPGLYYLPSFIWLLSKTIMLSGSYIVALQVLLFAISSSTLCLYHLMLDSLFPGRSQIAKTAVTILANMSVIYISGDVFGLWGLNSVLARYVVGALLPLVVMVYVKSASNGFLIGKVPCMPLMSIVLGLLVHIHPQSAATVFSMLLAHWALMRGLDVCRLPSLGKASSSLLALSFSVVLFAIPSGAYLWKFKEAQSAYMEAAQLQIASVATPASQNINSDFEAAKTLSPSSEPKESGKAQKHVSSGSPSSRLETAFIDVLRRLCFPATAVTAMILAFLFMSGRARSLPCAKELSCVSSLFFVAVAAEAFTAFLCALNPDFLYLHPFRRSCRNVIFIESLLLSYFIINIGGLSASLRTRCAIVCAAAFFWLSMSKTEGDVYLRTFIDMIPPLRGLSTEALTWLLRSGFELSLAGALLLSLAASGRFKGPATKLAVGTLLAFLLLWPLASGGVIAAAGGALDSLNGLGAWRVVRLATGSQEGDMEEDFNAVGEWIRGNTRETDKFHFYSRHKAQNLKLACMRRGLGSIYELGVGGSAYWRPAIRLNATLANGELASYLEVIDMLGIDHIAGERRLLPAGLLAHPRAERIFENGSFTVIRLRKAVPSDEADANAKAGVQSK